MATKNVPPIEALVRAMLGLRTQTGRDLAVLGGSWLDAVLQQNLTSNMRSERGYDLTSEETKALFDGRGFLDTTASKIHVAHGFGLMSRNAHKASLQLNRLRNDYAHTLEELTADSPLIAKGIDAMVFTPDDALAWLRVDNPIDFPHDDRRRFTFDGEQFDHATASTAIHDEHGRVYFFLPHVNVATRDDRLRQHIYACVIGAGGRGLKPWMAPAGTEGLAQLYI